MGIVNSEKDKRLNLECIYEVGIPFILLQTCNLFLIFYSYYTSLADWVNCFLSHFKKQMSLPFVFSFPPATFVQSPPPPSPRLVECFLCAIHFPETFTRAI